MPHLILSNLAPLALTTTVAWCVAWLLWCVAWKVEVQPGYWTPPKAKTKKAKPTGDGASGGDDAQQRWCTDDYLRLLVLIV